MQKKSKQRSPTAEILGKYFIGTIVPIKYMPLWFPLLGSFVSINLKTTKRESVQHFFRMSYVKWLKINIFVINDVIKKPMQKNSMVADILYSKNMGQFSSEVNILFQFFFQRNSTWIFKYYYVKEIKVTQCFSFQKTDKSQVCLQNQLTLILQVFSVSIIMICWWNFFALVLKWHH